MVGWYRLGVWMRTVLVLLALTAVATAQGNPAAEKVFQDGKALLAAGKTAEACDAFRRSQELEARVGTLLNLADCEEKRGRIASAWVAWVDARALAKRLDDARGALADQRAAALAPKLPYLTMKFAAAARPDGLVVRRNAVAVPSAELDLEVPLDPGRYDVEASAPGFVPWKQSIDLAIGQRATIEIPTLAIDASAPTPKPPGIVAEGSPPEGRSHRLGVGLAFGVSSDSDLLYGLRVPFHLIDAGAATIRAVPSVYYTHIVDDADVYHKIELFAAGFAVEYVRPFAPQFLVAAGLGVGFDIDDDSYQDSLSTQGWGAARLSPTLRLAHSVDLALHLQVVATTDNVVGLGSLGVDYFFW